MKTELSDKITWFLPDKSDHKLDDDNNNQSNQTEESMLESNDNRLNPTIVSRFWKVHQKLNNPFASPLTYSNLHQLQDVELHLVGSHICPLLDDAVQMYHCWKGQKSILMFDDLPHGFIQFVDQCKESRKATAKIADLVCSIIDQHSNSSLNKANQLNAQKYLTTLLPLIEPTLAVN